MSRFNFNIKRFWCIAQKTNCWALSHAFYTINAGAPTRQLRNELVSTHPNIITTHCCLLSESTETGLLHELPLDINTIWKSFNKSFSQACLVLLSAHSCFIFIKFLWSINFICQTWLKINGITQITVFFTYAAASELLLTVSIKALDCCYRF